MYMKASATYPEADLKQTSFSFCQLSHAELTLILSPGRSWTVDIVLIKDPLPRSGRFAYVR